MNRWAALVVGMGATTLAMSGRWRREADELARAQPPSRLGSILEAAANLPGGQLAYCEPKQSLEDYYLWQYVMAPVVLNVPPHVGECVGLVSKPPPGRVMFRQITKEYALWL